jgi:hypothetical protein
MDDNARPHRSRAVTAYLQGEAVTSVPWPALSPDLNPIGHIWDMSILSIDLHSSKSTIQLPFHFQNVTYELLDEIYYLKFSTGYMQSIRQLEATLHREWQQLSQQYIRRLTGGMRRRVEAVIQERGVYRSPVRLPCMVTKSSLQS